MTRAIACQSRTIRLPVHLSERLTTIRKVRLAHKLGAMPSRGLRKRWISLLRSWIPFCVRLSTSSLDAGEW